MSAPTLTSVLFRRPWKIASASGEHAPDQCGGHKDFQQVAETGNAGDGGHQLDVSCTHAANDKKEEKYCAACEAGHGSHPHRSPSSCCQSGAADHRRGTRLSANSECVLSAHRTLRRSKRTMRHTRDTRIPGIWVSYQDRPWRREIVNQTQRTRLNIRCFSN